MLPFELILIITALYWVVNSKSISEQAQREKWPLGGNRKFLVVLGLSVAVLLSAFAISDVLDSFDSDRSPSPDWWRWFFLIVGILMFTFGVVFVTRSAKIATDYRNLQISQMVTQLMLVPFRSSRCVLFAGIYNLAWGVWLIWVGRPF